MKHRHRISPIELLLARTLSFGTWISAGVIFVGLAWALGGAGAGRRVVGAGIGVLILLPAFRVLLMLGAFVRKREYRFAVFAMIVLIVIACGFALGMRTRGN